LDAGSAKLLARAEAAEAEVARLEKALKWLARNDVNGWVKEKVTETLRVPEEDA
jgi:hypothetical protein